jgi:hypothetical protein
MIYPNLMTSNLSPFIGEDLKISLIFGCEEYCIAHRYSVVGTYKWNVTLILNVNTDVI